MKVFSLFVAAFLGGCQNNAPDLQLWQNLCKHSTYGEARCRSNLQQFLRSSPEGPLSDYELEKIFGPI